MWYGKGILINAFYISLYISYYARKYKYSRIPHFVVYNVVQIFRVAQGCHFDNQVKFASITHMSTNHIKKVHRKEHF